MTALKNAQDMLSLAALCSDPAARRIMEVMAASSLIEDPAAKRGAEQALSLALTASATEAMSQGMSNSQAGTYRDVSIERNGAIVARFTGGHTETIHRFGDRLIHQTADVPALPAPANHDEAERIAAE